MNVPKVSVIVAVFNVEKYVAECLDSIARQTFTDFECIVVNDGSVDNTQKIIEKYPKRDARFELINKSNGGVSTARNAGLDAARGQYVIFLDGDDFYEPQLLERLYAKIVERDADIAVCNFENYFPGMKKTSEPRVNFGLLKNADHTSYKLDPDNIFNVLTLMFWNKMFRVDFLRAHSIRNDIKLHRAQDIDAVARALVETEQIVIVDEVLVYYRTEAGNSNVGRLYKYPYDVLQAVSNVKKYLEAKSLYKKLRKSYTKFTVDHILTALYVTEIYPAVHKQIFARSKRFLVDISVREDPEDYFSDEKSLKEARTLVGSSYEAWLQFRIADLRDDRESKYISYLLGEFQRKYAEALAERNQLQRSVSWRVTKPLRSARRFLK